MDFVALQAMAKDMMAERKVHLDREIGSVYDHGLRVSKEVLFLREKIFPNATEKDDCLRCAALFHDVAKGIKRHGKHGAILMRGALQGYATEEEIDWICDAILHHDDRKHAVDLCNPYVKLLQDADMLDHLGTYKIWMVFNEMAHRGMGVNGAVADFSDLDEYYDKNIALLNYGFSVQIAEAKRRYVTDFANRFAVEAAGNFILE